MATNKHALFVKNVPNLKQYRSKL